jgi:poly(hydroxyalkanoate) depolymerase family esterase
MAYRLATLASVIFTIALALAFAQPAAGLTPVPDFGSNPGNLLMYEHAPPGLPADAPLVVVLHGCLQDAAVMEGTGWTALADAWRFYLVYAQQQSTNNPASCFNFFEPGDQARGAGEPLSIKQMVDRMLADHAIDSRRVFVVGFSAGGAMAAVMAATYPDVFAGAAVLAGLPYQCATNAADAFACMKPGRDKTPQQWGDLVRAAHPTFAGAYPRLSIWTGTADSTVVPSNAAELVEQWTQVHQSDQVADLADTVDGYPHRTYRDQAGVPVVETYEITDMGHAVGIDPQFSYRTVGRTVGQPAGTCGTAGPYMLDRDICSAYRIAGAFGLDPTARPTVAAAVR